MNKHERLMMSFRSLLYKLRWLDKINMEEVLDNYKPFEVHCIDYIGKNDNTNVTKLAKSFCVTNGAISKVAAKLIKKGAVEKYQKATNKKEVYLKLTDEGKKVYNTHKTAHKVLEERDNIIFEDFSDDELAVILKFTDKYLQYLNAEIEKNKK